MSLEHDAFVSLVERMREAQREFHGCKDMGTRAKLFAAAIKLEQEVDQAIHKLQTPWMEEGERPGNPR